MPGFAWVCVWMTPATKSPSITCAALGGFAPTGFVEVAKSVCRAPLVPPKMLSESESTLPISVSASVTEGSVHLISCATSWSYFSGPAVRR